MNEAEVRSAVKDFEEVIKASERLSAKGTRLSAILGTFFAMGCAFRIRRHLGVCGENTINEQTEHAFNDSRFEERWTLPKPDAVHNAAERLIAAAISQDYDVAANTLAEMGVMDLCPGISQQFARMEFVARSVKGPAQLIPLVELSLFAVEMGEFERAGKYTAEAHSFNPNAYELYNLCIVEGVIAMNAGQQRQAIQFVEQAIGACQRDEYASLACGVRAPNLALAERLLDGGHRVEVLKHLFECKNVWQSFRSQIEVWISLIESGARPTFQESAMLRSMNEPACRLIMQYSRARALDEGESTPQSTLPMSPAEVIARREQLKESYRRYKDRSSEGS
jgi:tetratricopeptide (TPR) repeat protein